MNKKEVYEYLNSGVDKSGNLKKICGFRKHFPELYQDFLDYDFDEHIKNLSFKQKLWHFLNDTQLIPVCKICGNPVSFLTRCGQWGYSVYCSGKCAMHDYEIKQKLDNTKEERYGDRKYNNSEKQKKTISEKNESFWKNRNEKSLKTRYDKNDGKYFSDDTIQKTKETNKKRYNVESYTQTDEFKKIIHDRHDEIQEKQYRTKHHNKSFNTSSVEDKFSIYLDSLGIEYIRQYKSDKYPFVCDFYIGVFDLYVEINASWTHGGHPFNPSNPDDIEKLELWKSKESKYYDNAIYTWTDLDVRKKEIVEKNGLNHIEIFSYDIDGCINEFNDYFHRLVLDYCLHSEFPGTSKWPPEHPIWDCSVGKCHSPRCAWYEPHLMKSAVDNWFSIHNKDKKVERSYIRELKTCKIENNVIKESSKRFLELVLNRFTIAKIAPKVTAISDKTVKKIIDESGIDISKGVYVPMSGFGGIPKGVRLWGDEHNVDVECECYDINPYFCEWYGWTKKDMLYQKVKTDKVVICCPPFGKEYEHWKGTPREMSDIDFKDWYGLIKEYIDAPDYIIIGPEVGSKNMKTGLFSKSTGVMLWKDETF